MRISTILNMKMWLWNPEACGNETEKRGIGFRRHGLSKNPNWQKAMCRNRVKENDNFIGGKRWIRWSCNNILV